MFGVCVCVCVCVFCLVIHDKKSHFRYTSDNAINWFSQMAVGLEYIHNKNILHRDIKPSK